MTAVTAPIRSRRWAAGAAGLGTLPFVRLRLGGGIGPIRGGVSIGRGGLGWGGGVGPVSVTGGTGGRRRSNGGGGGGGWDYVDETPVPPKAPKPDRPRRPRIRAVTVMTWVAWAILATGATVGALDRGSGIGGAVPLVVLLMVVRWAVSTAVRVWVCRNDGVYYGSDVLRLERQARARREPAEWQRFEVATRSRWRPWESRVDWRRVGSAGRTSVPRRGPSAEELARTADSRRAAAERRRAAQAETARLEAERRRAEDEQRRRNEERDLTDRTLRKRQELLQDFPGTVFLDGQEPATDG